MRFDTLRFRIDRNLLRTSILFELDFSVNKSEQREVPAHADVCTRMEMRTALTDNDTAGFNRFSGVFLYTKIFGVGITAVTNGALTFLVSHY